MPPKACDLGLSHIYRGWASDHARHPAGAANDLRRAAEFLGEEHGAKVVGIGFERSRAIALLAGLGGDKNSGVTRTEAAEFADQAIAVLRDAVMAGWARVDERKRPDCNGDAKKKPSLFSRICVGEEARLYCLFRFRLF